jgi:adenylate kinase family enzyme
VSRADAVVWLDPPRWICLARVVRRGLWHRDRSRSDMGEGCPERIDPDFLLNVWRFRPRARAATIALLDEAAARDKAVVTLRTREEVLGFLKT